MYLPSERYSFVTGLQDPRPLDNAEVSCSKGDTGAACTRVHKARY